MKTVRRCRSIDVVIHGELDSNLGPRVLIGGSCEDFFFKKKANGIGVVSKALVMVESKN